ncbi:DUF6249 domain-containing protein [Marivirga sp.]|uniref:DUF6249 domain-containing protein n=1 Tax=Marivirga sp. TaxID=2018662 RepID=UPI003DA778B6
MEAVITFIALFATIFGISYYFLYTRNKERLAMIESGADASLFQTQKKNKRIHPAYSITMVIGMLGIGIGIGLILALTIVHSIDMKYSNEPIFLSCIFTFGGLGLISSYFILRSLDKKDEKSDKLA